jgi:1,4-dihydroxy-2-naphthoate octaprenyltransferase
MVFMVVITWNWWFHRFGDFPWDNIDDRRNRLIHIFKNCSLFGLFLTLHRFVSRQQRCPNESSATKPRQSTLRRMISGDDCRPLFPRLLVAIRPWSFPAALSPLMITFVTLSRSPRVEVNWLAAGIFSAGIVSLQGAANLLNSFCDYSTGLDQPATAGDRTMVDSLVSRREFPFVFVSMCVGWFLSFILTIPHHPVTLRSYLAVCAVGVSLAVLYSYGSRPLKYLGLGDLTVFISFGPLLVIAASIAVVPTGDPDLTPVILRTFPAALLVVAILHANNHRDLTVDESSHARTLSVRLGRKLSEIYFNSLLIGPVIYCLLLSWFWPQHRGLSLGCLVTPFSLRLIKIVTSGNVPRDIDAQTAQVMLLFGVCVTIGIVCI